MKEEIEDCKVNDPVRAYLREMGRVPLLSRDGEVEIAKKMDFSDINSSINKDLPKIMNSDCLHIYICT